jgi:hypothetical protein
MHAIAMGFGSESVHEDRMASTSFGRVFLLRVVRQFALAEGREKFDEVLSPARARWFQGGRPIHRDSSNGEFVCFSDGCQKLLRQHRS